MENDSTTLNSTKYTFYQQQRRSNSTTSSNSGGGGGGGGGSGARNAKENTSMFAYDLTGLIELQS